MLLVCSFWVICHRTGVEIWFLAWFINNTALTSSLDSKLVVHHACFSYTVARALWQFSCCDTIHIMNGVILMVCLRHAKMQSRAVSSFLCFVHSAMHLLDKWYRRSINGRIWTWIQLSFEFFFLMLLIHSFEARGWNIRCLFCWTKYIDGRQILRIFLLTEVVCLDCK